MTQEPKQPTVERTQMRFETLLSQTGQAFVRLHFEDGAFMTMTTDDTRALGLQLLDAAAAGDVDSGITRMMLDNGSPKADIQAILNALALGRNYAYDNPFQGSIDPVQASKGRPA